MELQAVPSPDRPEKPRFRYNVLNMPSRRDTRRLAMQVLYQIDIRGEDDMALIHEGLGDGPATPQVSEAAYALALGAWESRRDADAAILDAAPEWPTHRQPPVDRAILRLAYHEVVTGYAPAAVVINEAVELAKEFSAEQSAAFINAVLDKIARKLGPIAPKPPKPEGGSDPQLSELQWM